MMNEEESDFAYNRLRDSVTEQRRLTDRKANRRRLSLVCQTVTLVVVIMALIISLAVILGICLSGSGCHAQDQRVTLPTPLGNVSGLVAYALDGVVYQFLGIPYAEPPIGPLRFRKPVPVSPWPNTLDATWFGPSCPQRGWDTNEDCLYLNIYTRANDSGHPGGPKPVMIWIHGGGFVHGSGRDSDGTLMAVTGDVVVVTINYRLGMLGWLSTMDVASPGNYGLWDQKMAMEWVRDNIAAFGGDPNQITIFGESGGGYSVGLHALSPLNNGLFQRAIMQSGSALNRRTIALDPVGFAHRLADYLGCLKVDNGTVDNYYLVECARQRSVADILEATEAAASIDIVAWRLNVAPVIDGDLIPTDVHTLLGPQYRGRVPFWKIDIMVGVTNAEGSLVLTPLSPFQRALGFHLANGIPREMFCTNITTSLARDYFRGSQEVANDLCRQYSTQQGDEEQGRQVVNMYGDMMFVSAALETLQRHANGSRGSNYQYLFSYSPRTPFHWFRGAGHGAEVRFLFGLFVSGPEEERLSQIMMDGWTNFAKFGTPNNPQIHEGYQWPAYDMATKAYTNLDFDVTSQRDLYSDRMQFWLETIPSMHTDFVPATPRPQYVGRGRASTPHGVVGGSISTTGDGGFERVSTPEGVATGSTPTIAAAASGHIPSPRGVITDSKSTTEDANRGSISTTEHVTSHPASTDGVTESTTP